MLKVSLLKAAEAEMADAICWYEEKETGLGTALRRSMEKTILSIQANPLAFPIIHGSIIRRALTSRFPFTVIYLVDENSILIIAVFHTSRNPLIWRGRID